MTGEEILRTRTVLGQYLKKTGMETDEVHRAALSMSEEQFYASRDYLEQKGLLKRFSTYFRPTDKAIDGMKDLATLLPVK